MGLSLKKRGQGYAFYKINSKEGCIQYTEIGEDGEKVKNDEGKSIVRKETPGMATVTGLLDSIELLEQEYQGNKSRSLRMKLLDQEEGKPTMMVDFPYNSDEAGPSFFGIQILARINSADLNKPISFTPWFMKAGTKSGNFAALEKDKSGCTVAQGGKKLETNYGDGITELPKLEMVKVGKKLVKDKGEWDKILDGLFDQISANLVPAEPGDMYDDIPF